MYSEFLTGYLYSYQSPCSLIAPSLCTLYLISVYAIFLVYTGVCITSCWT